MKGISLSLSFLALISLSCFGQQYLSLSEADIELLGLKFAPVAVADGQAGIELPAQVVASPDAMTEVRTRFSGVLERWNREAGSLVEQGEILAVIRSPEVLSLQQQFLVQHNNLTLETQRLEREQQLLTQGIISEQRFQQSEGQQRAAELAANALVLQLQQAGLNEVNLRELRQGELETGALLLRAPQSGLLTHRAYRVGQYIEANDVVASLDEPGNPWVAVQVPARLASYLEIGSSLSLQNTAETLTLRQRDFAIDTVSQSMEVLAQFDSPADYLPGQLLTIALQPGQGALFVPADAVVHDGSETQVYIRTREGVEARSIRLLPVGSGYLTSAGLSAGDEILVQGAALVKGIQLGLGTDQ